MNKQFEQCRASDGAMNRVTHDRRAHSGFGQWWKNKANALLLAAGLLPMAAAQAAVQATGVDLPDAIGLQMPFEAKVSWQRASPGAADTVTVTLPQELELAPGKAWPSGCTLTGASLACIIPASEREGELVLPLVANAAVGFNLDALGNTGPGANASRTVLASGDLTVTKSKVSPTGDVIAGQDMEFRLEPKIGTGGSDVPAGATLVVTDTLPTSFTGAVATANGLPASCVAGGGKITCTYTGPFTAAQFNAASITVKGKQGAGNGGFTNLVSIAEGADHKYLDRDEDNNGGLASYQVTPGSDIEALINFPNGPHAAGDTDPKTLTLSYKNNGPMDSAGGSVQTVIPPGFVLDESKLPAGCVATQSSSLQLPGGATYSGTLVTCTFSDTVSANNGRKDFPLVVTLPGTETSGEFPVLVTPPANLGDPNPGNNQTTTPYSVRPPYANQELAKTKSPGTGPQKPGTEITTTLRITNSAQSSSALTYSSPDHPLRVVDFMRPEEAKTDAYGAGLAVGGVTSGWLCELERNVSPLPAGVPATHTTRVVCTTTNTTPMTLAKGNSLSVTFKTTIADMAPNAAPVELTNNACTGSIALQQLGLQGTAGPLPSYNTDPSLPQESRGSVCAAAGSGLWGTPVGATPDSAIVAIKKESSLDQIAWHDAVTDAPELAREGNKLYWRITITAASGGDQLTIPTLRLRDQLPGILNNNLGNTTPAIPLVVRRGQPGAMNPVPAGSTTNNCPAQINAGANGGTGTLCTFKDVKPAEVIEIIMDVSRPLGPGADQGDGTWRLTNAATLSSPDALLSGTLTDAAAVDIAPRMDVELVSKQLDEPSPAVGQRFTFRIEARNRGPFAVPAGAFTIEDTLFTGEATLAQASYDILAVTSATNNLTCQVHTPVSDQTKVSCVNSGNAIGAGNTETMLIEVRLKKPTLDASHVAGSKLYTGLKNTATVLLDDAYCEYRVDGQASGACNDPSAVSNNDKTATFDVSVPRIDLEQGKVAIDPSGNPYPAGKARFNLGDTLRYRFTTTNHGPSQAVGVQMRDQLELPAHFTVDNVTVVSSQLPDGAGAVNCAVATGPTSDPALVDGKPEIRCHMGNTLAGSILEASQSLSFDLALTLKDNRPAGDVGAVSFGNTAIACSDESMTYETNGKCSFAAGEAGNNRAGLSHLVTPKSDLGVTKTTVLDPARTAVDIGEPVQYQIVVDNGGINATNKIRIVDRLPTGFEWLTSGVHAPKAVAGGGASVGTLTVSGSVPADGTDNVCYISNSVTSVSQASQYQQVTCDLGGLFPVATKVATITLWARPVPGVYNGSASAPYNTDRINTVEVQPGRDAAGQEVSTDDNPGNNTDDSPVRVQTASLGGRVFADNNDNGEQDSGDIGIANVDVTLSGTDLYGNRVSITVKTNASGDYQFDNLVPSNADGYTIVQAQPAGYTVNGTPKPDSQRSSTGVAPKDTNYAISNDTTVSSTIGGVVLGSGGNGLRFDFPEPLERTLSGHVYIDQDNNNVLSSADARIAGAKVYLEEVGSSDPAREATTDAQGFYEFRGLTASKTYVLREPLPTNPAGLLNQPLAVNPGKINNVLCGAACAPATTGTEDTISGIQLVAGNGTEFNFGENITSAISGKVYLDRDDNGQQNGTEPGIPGVDITITDANGTVVWNGKTDSNGNYTFPGAVAGQEYTITQTQPNGLKDGQENTSNSIHIPSLPPTGSTGNNFGELAASLSGRIYLDQANDGHTASDPGLGNVQVTLSRVDGQPVIDVLGNTVSVLTTAADGRYAFIDLPAGDYIVTEQTAQPSYTPAGGVATTTLNGITTAGTVIDGTAGIATAVLDTPSAITGVSLNAGGKSVDNNFGEILPVSVSGKVFFDLNNDGVQDLPGDQGISGVDIRLVGTDDLGNAVNITLTSNADGSFNFDGLRPGNYTLIEPTQPAGTAQGKTTAGSAGGTASNNAAPESSKIAAIDLSVPGSVSEDNLFAEVPTNSAITGKVWNDVNNDGVVDAGETGIAGVELELTGKDINGNPIPPVTVTTDADGNYAFTDLPPGTYKVVEKQQPAGTNDGKTVPGNIGGTPMGNGSAEGSATAQNPSFIDTVTVGVGQVSVENNFGEVPAASISGSVYNDSNDDGIRQPEEGGFANVTVELTGTDDLGNPVTLTTTTDANGKYSFDNLRPGTYVVTEPNQPLETLNGKTTAGSTGGTGSNPSSTTSEITGIVLKPGDKSVDNNFGEIGDSPDMLVSKSSTTVKFTVNNVATYTIVVRNGGQQPSQGEYIVKDRLPVGLTLAEIPSGTGWTCSGAVGDARFECRSSEVLNPGVTSASAITVKANVSAEAAKAGTVNNAVLVEGGGENEFRTPTTSERTAFDGDVSTLPVCDTAITQNACRVPNQVQLSASVGGTVWFDIGSEDTFLDGGDERLPAWIVELLDPATGLVSKTTTTAADGSYRFGDVVPGVKWNIQFRDPSSGVLWAWPVNQETSGGFGMACDGARAIKDSGTSACRITENGTSQLQVVLKAGEHLPQQSLPVDPSGVVYDAVTRDPVPGSIVTLTPVGVCNGYDPNTAILNAGAGGYRVEGNAVSMTVGNNGYYQFMFGPAAPARCEFQLTVTPPGGYQFVSSLIPPQDGSLSPLGAAGSSHLVQPQANAPTGAVGTPTQYWLTVFAGSATAGIVHNHLPLDTAAGTGLVITKTGDRQTAEIGDTVQYTITVRQTSGSAMETLNIVDTLPRGFTYIDGTARVGGRALDEPFGKPGPRLGFNLGPINVGQQLVLTYRVRVGVGAQQGDGINRAQAHGCSITGGCIEPGSMTPVPGSVPSNRAEYRVRVTGGVFTEEACVLGKVFVDCNNNHVQDHEELGIPGVRLYFSNGTWMISDSEGKYSYCGLPPQSHTLKVDPSTLPAGARLTTSSNRNLGDADSLFLDLKNGELHRADFVEGSCSNPLLEQVKARRTQGEVRAPETETGQSPLRFESKPARAPQQATDSANQRPIVHPRPNPPSAPASQEVQP